ncbi:hypothetical protein DRQ53_14095 [bacterium]|nr:MAG: hypothetical protein DRQ53_14095 [bacterium]
MGLHHPHGIQERILLMGGAGSGKTRAWLSIADMARKTKSDAKFYVIDTDFAVERMLSAGFEKLRDYGSLEVVTPFEFPDYTSAAEDFRKRMGPDDWLIVDLMNHAWEEVQNHYSNEVFGKSKGDYFLEVRKGLKDASKGFQAFEGWTDWNIIKPMYTDFANKVYFGHKGHTLICTSARAVDRGSRGKGSADPKEIIQAFGHIGFRPEGEKRTAHNVHTVLLMSQKNDETWNVDTGKDRERDRHRGLKLGPDHGQFVREYLIKTAGWKRK